MKLLRKITSTYKTNEGFRTIISALALVCGVFAFTYVIELQTEHAKQACIAKGKQPVLERITVMTDIVVCK